LGKVGKIGMPPTTVLFAKALGVVQAAEELYRRLWPFATRPSRRAGDALEGPANPAK
jgi:hypothetical protein